MGLRAAIKRHTNGKKAFELAAEGKFEDAFKLIDDGGDVNYSADYGFTGFRNGREVSGAATCNMGFIALQQDNMEALEELLKRHLNPNATSRDGRLRIEIPEISFPQTMLALAINLGKQKAVDLLINAGARTDAVLPDATFNHIQTMPGLARKKGISLSPV